MAYAKLASVSSGVRGTHYSPGMNHVYFLKNNNNTGIGVGHLCRIRVTPLEKISEGTLPLSTGQSINLNTGAADIQFTGLQVKALTPTKTWRYSTAPTNGLSGIDPASLGAITYDASNKAYNSGDEYYAASLGSGQYAVFRIYSQSGTTKIDWITYKLSVAVEIVGYGYTDPRDVIITPDLAIAYVSAADENNQDCVLRVENVGTSVPNFSFNANDASLYAINDPAQPLTSTAQIAIDPGNPNSVYVVDATGLWKIEVGASTTKVADLPNGGVGLLVDDNQKAIISDSQGNIYEVDLAEQNPAPTQWPETLGGPSGFLTWADESKLSFYAGTLDAGNKVRLVNRSPVGVSDVLAVQTWTPALLNPWSVEVLSPNRLFVVTDTTVDLSEVGTFDLITVSNVLVLGIGLVPFDYIIQDSASPHRGRADTTPAVGYFYQVNKVPFGGNLNLMINHSKAHSVGIRHFRVTLTRVGSPTSTVITDAFTDLLWKPIGGIPKFYPTPVGSTGPTPVAPVPANAYPIRAPGDLWYNAHLGMVLPTKSTDNGLHEVKFEFFDQNGVRVDAETKTYVVLLDNNKCNAMLKLPRMGNPPPTTYPTLDCGCITYNSKNDKVALDFAAWQVNGEGTYTMRFSRGGQGLPGLTQTGPTSVSNDLQTKSTTNMASSPTFKVGHLTGNCNIAGIVVDINVPPRVIDGYRWVPSSYAWTRLYFTLVPDTVPMSSPWVDPGG